MRFTQFFALIAAAVLSVGSVPTLARPVQLTDAVGRKVTVDLPAKRVTLGFYYQDYVAIGSKTALGNVVGLSKAVWADWAPSSWMAFSKTVPKLNQLTDVGEVKVGTFSIERVLALEPDLLVLVERQYKVLGSDPDRIDRAGIPIVVLDYSTQAVARHVQSTKLVGTLASQQQKVDKLAADYKHVADTIQAHIQKADLPKPKVYIGLDNKGPAKHSATSGKSMWGSMATLVGGNNIAVSSVKFYGPINPEEVLTARPDVIVITSRETGLKKDPAAIVMGWGIPKAETEERLVGFTKRAGQANLPAVKNNRLYAAYHANSRTLSDSTSIQLMTRATYPQLFRDFNSEKTYLGFYRQNLPVIPNGTFYLYPKGQQGSLDFQTTF